MRCWRWWSRRQWFFALKLPPRPVRAPVVLPRREPSAAGVSQSGLEVLKTAVILLQTPTTPATALFVASEVREAFFGPAASVRAFYHETSDGRCDVQGEVFGPVTIDQQGFSIVKPADMAILRVWYDQADAAVTALGIDLTQYARRVYLIPLAFKSDECPSGRGVYGLQRAFHFAGAVPLVKELVHELGHTLGLNHASTVDAEYGDNSDVMGSGRVPLQLNGPHRVQMGWLMADEVVSVSRSGVYQLGILEQAGDLPRVMVLPRRDDASQAWYLTFRQPLGFDAALPEEFVGRTSIHQYSSVLSTGYQPPTLLLATVGDGEIWADTQAGITVRQVQHTATAVTLRVQVVQRRV